MHSGLYKNGNHRVFCRPNFNTYAKKNPILDIEIFCAINCTYYFVALFFSFLAHAHVPKRQTEKFQSLETGLLMMDDHAFLRSNFHRCRLST